MTSGGTTSSSSLQAAAFGYGASTNNTSDDCACGGGGWYGGGSYGDSYGGGGSSFVWCDTYASYVPSEYTPSADLKMTDVELTPNTRSGDGYCRITVLEPPFTITYNANGGSSTPAAQTVLQGNSVTLASAISRASSSSDFQLIGHGNGHGSSTIAVAIETVTYNFSHWNTNSAGTGTNYSADSSIIPSDNMVLYARWSTIPNYSNNTVASIPVPASTSDTTYFTLTGDGNGGTTTATTASQTITYTFNNWNTNADGSGVSYDSTSTTQFTSPIVLYAQWNATSTYSGNRVCDIPIPTRQNYTFIGWNTKADGSGTTYASNSTHAFTSDTILYAQWREIIQCIPYIYTADGWQKYELRLYSSDVGRKAGFNNKYKVIIH